MPRRKRMSDATMRQIAHDLYYEDVNENVIAKRYNIRDDQLSRLKTTPKFQKFYREIYESHDLSKIKE